MFHKISIYIYLIVLFIFGSYGLYKIISKKNDLMIISSGHNGGVFFNLAQDLCKRINEDKNNKKIFSDRISCLAKETEGSIVNLEALESNDHVLAIAQTILQNDIFTGNGLFFEKDKKNYKIRTLATLHSEYFTIITNKDSGINKITDLAGKKLSIENEKSGSRKIFEKIIGKQNLSLQDFTQISEQDFSSLEKSFCNKDIDAAILFVGHPNKVIQDLITNCNAKIVSLTDNDIKLYSNLAKESFIPARINAKTYDGQEDYDVNTISIKTVLSANSDLDNRVVADFVTSLLKTYPYTKGKYISENDIAYICKIYNKESPIAIAPIHDGAEYIYKDWCEKQNLLPENNMY